MTEIFINLRIASFNYDYHSNPFRWRTRDKPFDRQPPNTDVQMESTELEKIDPLDVFAETITPSSHSNQNEYVFVLH